MIDRLEGIARRYREIEAEKGHKGVRPPLWGTPRWARNAFSYVRDCCDLAKPGHAGADR